MAATQFFSQTPEKQGNNAGFIEVGAKPFYALAAGLIDYCVRAQSLDENGLKEILQQLQRYFPLMTVTQVYLKPMEHMHRLIQHVRRTELVAALAYVLRQVVVDKLYAAPLFCPQAFDGLSAETSQNYLREEDSLLPLEVFSYIPQLLAIGLKVQVSEQEKSLANSFLYGEGEGIILQRVDNQYSVLVQNRSAFAYVGQLAIKLPQPVVNNSSESLSFILSRLSKRQESIRLEYKKTSTSLLSMVTANELCLNQLTGAYLAWLPTRSTALEQETYYAQSLQSTGTESAKKEVVLDSETYVRQEIIHFLSLWVATGQIEDAQLLFDSLESIESHALSSIRP